MASTPKAGPYPLRSRIPLWLKQILFFFHLTFILYSQILPSIFEFKHLAFLNILSSLLYIASCSITIWYDGIQQLYTSTKTKRKWIVSYSILLLYNIILYLKTQDSISLILLISMVSILSCVIISSFLTFEILQIRVPTPEFTSGIWNFVSFSYLNDILILPGQLKASLEYEDVPHLVDADSGECGVWDKFKILLRLQKQKVKSQSAQSRSKNHPNPINSPNLNLISLLFLLVRREFFLQGVFQFLASSSVCLAPLAIERILLHIANNGDDDEVKALLPIDINTAMFLLLLGPVLKGIGDGQNYSRGRHIGIRIKAALIGAIFHKSLTVDLSASDETIGKLNNLISVDVTEIQNFCCYSHYIWSTPFEILICCGLLFFVMGRAALAGLGVMVIALVFGLMLGRILEQFQDKLLVNKDGRMAQINELLNSIRIIKLFAWESKFIEKVVESRKKEIQSLKYYVGCSAVLYVLWDIVPAVVGVVAFAIHVHVLGFPLSPSIGFTAITLFNVLRWPLAIFPEMINSFARSRISMKRIEKYILSDDVKGISWSKNNSPIHKNNSKSRKSLSGSIYVNNLTLAWPHPKNISENGNNKASKMSNIDIKKFLCGERNCFRYFNVFGIKSTMNNLKNYKNRKSDIAYQLLDNTDNIDEIKSKNNNIITDIDDDLYDSNDVKVSSPLKALYNSNLSLNSHNKGALRMSPIAKNDLVDEEVGLPFNDIVHDHSIILKDISVSIDPGSLVVVVGMTGSGKSTFLQGGLLGECKSLSGFMEIQGSISYVSQSAWIQNATVRDNILFGSENDKERYEKVIYACALQSDLKLLPSGDMTEIGEKGVNLSGGQQQRVSLARASYSKSDIIILDDPLSAVDTHVGEHIFKNLVLDFLQDRTRIIVSHNLALTVPPADKIMFLSNNQVVAYCSPNELKSTMERIGSKNKNASDGAASVFVDGLIAASQLTVAEITEKPIVPNIISYENINQMYQNNSYDYLPSVNSTPQQTYKKKHPESNSNSHQPHEVEFLMSEPSSSSLLNNTPLQHQHDNFESEFSTIVFNSPLHDTNQKSQNIKDENQKNINDVNLPDNIVSIETKSSGDVPLIVYWKYVRATGGFKTAILLLCLSIGINASWLIQGYCFGSWMAYLQEGNHRLEIHAFVIYLIASWSILVTTFLRITSQVLGALEASKKLHTILLTSVMRAPCWWFDATPVGRIINRFSQDISTLDSELMSSLMGFLDCCLGTIQIIAVVAWVLPYLLIPFIPIIFFTLWVSKQYLHISRELKRLESIKKSPVFVLFSETLLGLPVIRAFRQEQRFLSECFRRIDELHACHLYLWLSNRWLNFRMQMLGAIVAGSVGMAVVYDAGKMGNTAAGIVLIYSLSFCDNLTFLARMHAENLSILHKRAEAMFNSRENVYISSQQNEDVIDKIMHLEHMAAPLYNEGKLFDDYLFNKTFNDIRTTPHDAQLNNSINVHMMP
eukprot:gene8717-11778_t